MNIHEFFDHQLYTIKFLEWWDGNSFHRIDWNNDEIHGKVKRSSQFYDGRITQSEELQELLFNTTPQNMRNYYRQFDITYTSLIFDLIKKCE